MIMQLNSQELRQIELQSHSIVKNAGKQIMASWMNVKTIDYKDLRDIASNVDREVEEAVRLELKKLLPDAGFLVEEGLDERKSEYNWTIDPIDGTKHYVAGMPMFSSQFALTYRDEPVLGCVYNPFSDQLFSASLGNGTTLNGKNIKLDFRNDPQSMIIDVDLGKMDEQETWKAEKLQKIATSFFRMRIFGGVFSIYTLTGALDGVVVLNQKTKFVDQAPRIILNREAGYKVDYITLPENIQILVTASPAMFDFIAKLLA